MFFDKCFSFSLLINDEMFILEIRCFFLYFPIGSLTLYWKGSKSNQISEILDLQNLINLVVFTS